jgi:hypothetical protein
MRTKKVNQNNPLPISPQDLPDDGTPISFTQTFAKNVGGKVEDERMPTADDYEDAEWQVRRQTVEGWEFVEKVESRPFDEDLRVNYGPGKYELTPLDPRTGKPVPPCKIVRLISAVVTPPTTSYLRDEYLPPPPMTAASSDEMPAWMRYQMQQAAEERAEARRQAAEAAARQREFEEKMALREFERQEREERAQRAREAKEQDEARRRDQRMSELISAGVTLATTVLANKNNQPPPRDVNEVLLQELREARRERAPATNGMRDSLDLLIVLDKLAQNRAEMAAGRRGDDDEDSTSKMMMQMLPLVLGGRGGGGGGGVPQLSPDMVEGMLEQAFSDSDLIQKIASKNPGRTASAFMRAVKSNPALENAVLTAIDKENADD